ncbi:CpsB/CapC family capsule biosynthesis tyrosine phosphatase [Desulfobacula sp.]|uniref:tyrosine-protein phosphatase n=1 Tax=Desulfobacula sp. TaxID=2593537 RepID=UPI00262965EE|nr:CpsB/CapC family capsule biosynthesis tyrosine phosphatase [Desulfobacula sp.]
MIDTHSHILPAMDDGARDLTESIEFVKTAAAQGVDTIFATPHAFNGVFNCTKENIIKACDTLTEALCKESILTRVLPGSEIRVNHDIIVEYDKGNLLTLNNSGSWLLLELPDVFMANAVCLMIRQLRERGLTPIIAHAERNLMVINKPELINEFIYNGAVIQITAGSLTGDFGKFSMKAAKAMVSRDQVFCLGSDIHPGRKYRMADAKKKLIKLLGRTKADLITHENPAAILEDTNTFYKREYRKKAY